MDASPFAPGVVDAAARLIERALALPQPLAAPLRDSGVELFESAAGHAVSFLASFERTHGTPPDARLDAGEQACAWGNWLGEAWGRRWGPPALRAPEPSRALEDPDVARLVGRHARTVAWSREARWFGAAVWEPDGDASVHVLAFVARIGEESGPPGPPPILADASPRAYRATERFAVGDRLEHTRFGPGRVIAVRGRSIEVEFSAGARRLAHGG